MPLQDTKLCISNNKTALKSWKDIVLCTDKNITFVISSSEATHYPSNLTVVSQNDFYSSEKSAYPT